MSNLVLTQFFATGSLLSALGCCWLEIAMDTDIRRGLKGWQPTQFKRDIGATFRSHRRFCPGSPLRRAFIVSSCLLGGCIAALIVIYRLLIGI